MEVIGTATALIAVAEFSLKLFKACDSYYRAVKEAPREIKRLSEETRSFDTNLRILHAIATSPDAAKVPILVELMKADGPREECQALLRSLLTKLGEGNDRHAKRKVFKQMKWPLEKEDMDNGISVLERHRKDLDFALSSDNLNISVATNRMIAQIYDNTAMKQKDDRCDRILEWLPTTDTAMNHEEARKKHQDGTGEWLFKTDQWGNWISNRGSVMWLNGMPGCGKTVLAWTTSELDSISDVYVVVDALDESSLQKDARKEVLEAVKRLAGTKNTKLHLLLTSRPELDIVDSLAPLLTVPGISIQSHQIQADISHYVSTQIRESNTLRKLRPEDALRIQNTLTEKANGMQVFSDLIYTFSSMALCGGTTIRWVFCQMEVIRKCISSSDIYKALDRLPTDLNETYDRILEAIPKAHQPIAHRALAWLFFSRSPLLADVLAEASIIDPCA
ncbi:uncharacterized protein BDZ99DRAFT_514007 [Mytilinidion resinicola]|uniref:Nephrocystin 3-like N-terminal domain-containing protein n=1 Tax=Mytilinidion resinicola TaxID=574789 RepID=A0A6A6Z9I9_9PEZI|nr:uncharacterized protein BDZ99DRAFT_514007 [Mytilinidion resinicola]KAF2817791.1 hypothetical protein BDZ99DRAFT_514007 [Mytilinidion resinicola]